MIYESSKAFTNNKLHNFQIKSYLKINRKKK